MAGNNGSFLTTKEVATLLHVNEKMIYALVGDKGLPATKVTGKWLFPKRLVEEWLETHILNYRRSGLSSFSESGVLLLAGSDDPLFQAMLNLYNSRFPDSTAFFANLGSMGGIRSLRREICHIGVSHLLQDDYKQYNFEFADRELGRQPVLVNFSQRQQGLVVRKNNPKKIEKIEDLARDDVQIVNRPLGTGTRLLLDCEIARTKISIKEINGYEKEAWRHLDAGLEVLSGRADAAPAISAVAGLLDLDFIPLRWERFDLLILKDRFFERAIQDFVGLLQDEDFKQRAASFRGYDLSLSGKMLFPDTTIKEEKK